jgi:curli biogenesis system outer membrane secretion channel CsgG
MNKLIPSVVLLSLLTTPAYAEPKQAKPSNAEQLQRQAANDVPHCARKLGTISIVDGDDPYGWTQYNLAPPQKLLKVIVQRSGCFNLVDRGTGLSAQRERDIGANLGHQRGSNVGQNQIRAADYVLVAEVQGANRNSQGSGAAGAVGGLFGGAVGGLLGGIKSRKLKPIRCCRSPMSAPPKPSPRSKAMRRRTTSASAPAVASSAAWARAWSAAGTTTPISAGSSRWRSSMPTASW